MKSLQQQTAPPDDALTSKEKHELYHYTNTLGARAVAETLKVSRLSLASAIAGLDVTKGTISLIRTNWSKLG